MNREECYEILELSTNASMEDVRKSYIKLSKKYHPDVNPTGKQQFQKINEAYNRIRSNEFNSEYSKYNNDHSDIYRQDMYQNFNYQHFKNLMNEIRSVYNNTKGRKRAEFVLNILFRVVLGLFGTIMSLWVFLKYSYDLLENIILMLLYVFTIVLMNFIDVVINLGFLLYNITIKPIFLLANFIFSMIGSTIRELRIFIVVSIIIVVLIKIIEQMRNNQKLEKTIVFLLSIVSLLIVVICDLILEAH